MFTKLYWGLWTILAVVTLTLFLTANITWLSITAVGFVACLLIFAGMICVTPTIVGPHADEFQHADAEPAKEKKVRMGAEKEFTPAGFSVRDRHA